MYAYMYVCTLIHISNVPVMFDQWTFIWKKKKERKKAITGCQSKRMGAQCQTSLTSVNSVTEEKKNLSRFPYELIERISLKKNLWGVS